MGDAGGGGGGEWGFWGVMGGQQLAGRAHGMRLGFKV